MKPILLLLLTLTASLAWAQEVTKPAAQGEQRVFSKVERVGEDNLRSFFMFSVSGHDYTIRADGRGERSFENARSRNFTLRVEQGHIEQISFLELEGDLLLIYQLSDKQAMRAYVVRLNQTTLKTLWLRPVSAVDLETARVEAGYLKMNAANAVVRVDLRSGELVKD